jgi:hypothetical protein
MSLNPYEPPQSPSPPADTNGIRRGVGLFFWALSALFVVSALAMLTEFVPLYFSGQHTPRNANLGLSALTNFVVAGGLWFAGRWFRQRGRQPHE